MQKSFITSALVLTLALLPTFSNAETTVSVSNEAVSATTKISAVANTFQELQTQASSAKAAVLEQLENEISRAIQEASSAGVSVEKLNAAIQTSYLDIKAKLNVAFDAPDIIKKIEGLTADIKTVLVNISEQLTVVSGRTIVINADAIVQLFEKYQTAVVPLFTELSADDGNLTFADSDNDGLSDFDEIFVYHTDPYQANTAGGTLTDGKKVFAGLDPLNNQPIQYEDAQTADITSPSIFTVSSIELKKTETSTTIIFEGTALPNSVITLYIYSTPIIVAVKTDAAGRWTYSLDKELDNGQHEVYVATVGSNGKILAKSSPIPFVKTANAITIGQNIAPAPLTVTQLLQKYLRLVILAIFITVFAVGFFFGKSSKLKNDSTISDADSNSNPIHQ